MSLEEYSHRTGLDPTAAEMKRIGYELIDHIVDHIDSLPDQQVAERQSNRQYQQQFGESLPSEPADISRCIDFFFAKIAPGMTRVNHPRFHAFIPCPSSFAGAVGMMLAAGTNPFVGSWLGGASIASLELMVLDWIKESLQLHHDCAGILTSGGSTANLVGLASAREKFGRDVLDRGVIYVSDEGHASVEKAARVLGFRQDNIREIPTDEFFRMDNQALDAAIANDRADGQLPFFVSANAGTTNTGAIDEFSTIASLCKRQKLWFHIDAAYGGFAAMVPAIRQQMEGLELSDSITLDPHKWLYCPMGVGCAFVKERQYLENAFSTHGRYLKDLHDDEVNFLERGPELSRPARVLPVWMVLRSAGQKQLINQIENDIELANLAAQLLLQDERFEIVTKNLSIVTFRHRSRQNETEVERTERDDSLMEATLKDGVLMLSSTTLKNRNALRFVVMNPRTTEQDVRRSVARIRAMAN